MTLHISRRCILAVLAASVAFLPAVPGHAGDELQELVAKQEYLVDQANKLSHELLPALDGSSKDFRQWIEGDGYKRLVGFTGETERLARTMMENGDTIKVGEQLNRLGEVLKKKVPTLPNFDGEERTRAALKEIFSVLGQFEEIAFYY